MADNKDKKQWWKFWETETPGATFAEETREFFKPIVSDISQWVGKQLSEPTPTYSWQREEAAPLPPEVSPYEHGLRLFGELYGPPGPYFDEAMAALTVPAPPAPEQRTRVTSIGGWDFLEMYNPETGQWDTYPEPMGRTTTPEEEAGLTEWQRENLKLSREEAAATATWQMQQLQQERESGLREQEWRSQQLALQKQQQLAQLAAQPHSWLEYAALSGEQPAIQPWMLPLMPQEYAGAAGEPIPGWGAESMAGMPALTRPSRQYQARMGPTALQQYQGYRQARTGERPEETEWRLWSAAPPGGRHRGLTQVR